MSTFIRNHAKGIIACDVCVAVTATFRILFVFVVIEHVSRRLLHINVTAHPTERWTIQQFREAIPADHPYCILIHDRDAIFSKAVDQNMSLGPGIPEPIRTLPVPGQAHRHGMPSGQGVVSQPILGGLHHDYRLEQKVA